MMTSKLAKQLKDVGFPQEGKEWFILGINERVFWPTLSELIEACGDSFSSLLNNFDEWHCYGISNLQIFVKGKTPEEAVAKLWLEINKK